MARALSQADTHAPAANRALTCLALIFITGCGHQDREVVVKERVLVAQPASLRQGPGDVVIASETQSATASPGTAAYNSGEEAAFFYRDLEPYGAWIDVEEYGPCWQPHDLAPGWRPYTVGHWEFTDDAGWLWLSDEPFGWCCYHYGRWTFTTRFGWCWVPGRDWASAWVVWRHGSGHVGWAPMPAVGFGVSVGVEIAEPPHWAFSFVEEKYMLDVILRERIVPVTRNVTLIKMTQNITRYDVVNGRVVNRGVDVKAIERRVGRPVPRRKLAEVADPKSVGLRGDQIGVYRPKLPSRSAARQSASGGQRPAQFVPVAPQRAEAAPQLEARRRALEEYHERLRAEMERRHASELGSVPAGRAREQLLATHAAERSAFEEHRMRAREARTATPRQLRLK
jgi:hypothetical protein